MIVPYPQSFGWIVGLQPFDIFTFFIKIVTANLPFFDRMPVGIKCVYAVVSHSSLVVVMKSASIRSTHPGIYLGIF